MNKTIQQSGGNDFPSITRDKRFATPEPASGNQIGIGVSDKRSEDVLPTPTDTSNEAIPYRELEVPSEVAPYLKNVTTDEYSDLAWNAFGMKRRSRAGHHSFSYQHSHPSKRDYPIFDIVDILATREQNIQQTENISETNQSTASRINVKRNIEISVGLGLSFTVFLLALNMSNIYLAVLAAGLLVTVVIHFFD